MNPKQMQSEPKPEPFEQDMYQVLAIQLAEGVLKCNGICLSVLDSDGQPGENIISYGSRSLLNFHAKFTEENAPDELTAERGMHGTEAGWKECGSLVIYQRIGQSYGKYRFSLSLSWPMGQEVKASNLHPNSISNAIESFFSLGSIWVLKRESHERAKLYYRALDALSIGCLAVRDDNFVIPINFAAKRLSKGQLVEVQSLENWNKGQNIPSDEPNFFAAWRMPTGELKPAYLQKVSGKNIAKIRNFVFIPPDEAPQVVTPAIRIGLGLTRSEAGLAAELARGLKVGEVAGELGLSEQTVRTYLKRVFGKLGISRQTELVALALAQSMPMCSTSDRLKRTSGEF